MYRSMTQSEAEEVLRLHMEANADPATVRAEDVAEALHIPPDEVEKLLERVRANQFNEQAKQAHRKRDRQRLFFTFALAVSITLLIGGALFTRERARQARWEETWPSGAVPPPPPLQGIEGFEPTEAVSAAEETAEMEAGEPVPAEYLVRPPGPLPSVRVGSGPTSTVIDAINRSPEQVAKDVEEYLQKHNSDRLPRSAEADQATKRKLESHSDRDPGLARVPIYVYREPEGVANWVYLPVYTGESKEIAELAKKERLRKIIQSLTG